LAEVNLLRRYPKAKRNIEKRTSAQSAENVRIAREYGREYFDGSRDTGYGGYRYDGRWVAIAEDMVAHWGLRPGDRVLDVGCGKGFLLKGSWTVSDNYFGIQPNGQKTDGTVYIDLTGTYPIGETGFSLVGHVGYLDVSKDGSGNAEASYTDWKAGVAYVVPDGVLKGVEFGAYYSGNNATSAFYTDLTGYDTSKDRGVVYVKKTF
jgi:SAM-dependent methyltransferase